MLIKYLFSVFSYQKTHNNESRVESMTQQTFHLWLEILSRLVFFYFFGGICNSGKALREREKNENQKRKKNYTN